MYLPGLQVGKRILAVSEVTGTILDISEGGMHGRRSVWINDEATGKDREIGSAATREWSSDSTSLYSYGNVPLRTGQRITIISAEGIDVLLVNHDAGKIVTLHGGDYLANSFFNRSQRRGCWGWVIALLLLFGGCSISVSGGNFGGLALGLLSVVLCAGAVYRFRKIPGVAPINAQLRELGAAVLRHGERQAEP